MAVVQSTGQEATVLTTRTIHSTAVMAFACLALLVFTGPAGAQGGGAQSPDMHASVALAQAKAQQNQDLRSADTRDAQRRQDLNPLRAGGYTPGANAVAPPLPGPPTWPVNPQPISPAPAVDVTDSGSGLDWTTIAIGIAGSLLVLGGIVAVVAHGRRAGRVHVSA